MIGLKNFIKLVVLVISCGMISTVSSLAPYPNVFVRSSKQQQPTINVDPEQPTASSIAEFTSLSSRRDTLAAASCGLGLAFAALLLSQSTCTSPALAFENKISNKYDDRPKRKGPQPKDLGVSTRISLEGGDEYLGLKPCGVAPNCFCSTMSVEEDPDHSIPAWTWPNNNKSVDSNSNSKQQQAFEELYQVLQSYPPGQAGIDGGGFKFQKVDVNNAGYIHVIYEALKNGYYDDVEFAYIPVPPDEAAAAGDAKKNQNQIQVRSSSRVGYLDLGVNAKRLNWIAKELRSKGWDAPGVDFKTHQGYALENQVV